MNKDLIQEPKRPPSTLAPCGRESVAKNTSVVSGEMKVLTGPEKINQIEKVESLLNLNHQISRDNNFDGDGGNQAIKV